jgi:hypothetical protein
MEPDRDVVNPVRKEALINLKSNPRKPEGEVVAEAR